MEDAHSSHQCRRDAAPVVSSSPRGRSYIPIADALMDPSGPLQVRASEGVIYTRTPDNGKSRRSKAQKEKDNRKIRKLFNKEVKDPGHIAKMVQERNEAKPKIRVRSAAQLEAAQKKRRESITPRVSITPAQREAKTAAEKKRRESITAAEKTAEEERRREKQRRHNELLAKMSEQRGEEWLTRSRTPLSDAYFLGVWKHQPCVCLISCI